MRWWLFAAVSTLCSITSIWVASALSIWLCQSHTIAREYKKTLDTTTLNHPWRKDPHTNWKTSCIILQWWSPVFSLGDEIAGYHYIGFPEVCGIYWSWQMHRTSQWRLATPHREFSSLLKTKWYLNIIREFFLLCLPTVVNKYYLGWAPWCCPCTSSKSGWQWRRSYIPSIWPIDSSVTSKTIEYPPG